MTAKQVAAAGFAWFFVPYVSLVMLGHHGNPNHAPYAGEPGSTYDAKANPPHMDGTVAYDPYKPVPALSLSQPSNPPTPGMGGGAMPNR
jgi:hypothetical protein